METSTGESCYTSMWVWHPPEKSSVLCYDVTMVTTSPIYENILSSHNDQCLLTATTEKAQLLDNYISSGRVTPPFYDEGSSPMVNDLTSERDNKTFCNVTVTARKTNQPVNCDISSDSCCCVDSQAVVPTHFSRTCKIEFKWKSHREWSLRLMTLIYKEVKLQSLMAWCNTLGGAHSSLGETALDHAKEAGIISRKQYLLSYEKGDSLMMSRCHLYSAFSLLQQGHLIKAKRIIKDEYQNLTNQTFMPDTKLINMCMSAWNKYRQLRDFSRNVTVSSAISGDSCFDNGAPKLLTKDSHM